MDYKKKGNLADVLSTEPISEEQAKYICAQLLLCANLLQLSNIIHRDFKPENVLINKSDGSELDICLSDFGIATETTDSEWLQYPCGTPGYVAPELIEGCDCTFKADVFGIGCLMFYLLSGFRLFQGNDTEQILYNNRDCFIVN